MYVFYEIIFYIIYRYLQITFLYIIRDINLIFLSVCLPKSKNNAGQKMIFTNTMRRDPKISLSGILSRFAWQVFHAK